VAASAAVRRATSSSRLRKPCEARARARAAAAAQVALRNRHPTQRSLARKPTRSPPPLRAQRAARRASCSKVSSPAASEDIAAAVAQRAGCAQQPKACSAAAGGAAAPPRRQRAPRRQARGQQQMCAETDARFGVGDGYFAARALAQSDALCAQPIQRARPCILARCSALASHCLLCADGARHATRQLQRCGAGADRSTTEGRQRTQLRLLARLQRINARCRATHRT
jgi:hypothetical protein